MRISIGEWHGMLEALGELISAVTCALGEFADSLFAFLEQSAQHAPEDAADTKGSMPSSCNRRGHAERPPAKATSRRAIALCLMHSACRACTAATGT